MKLSGHRGTILLSIWLIATGLLPLVRISLPGSGMILAILALAAGVLLLVGSSRTKLAHNKLSSKWPGDGCACPCRRHINVAEALGQMGGENAFLADSL